MSASDLEEQVFTSLWRGLVLAGLLTVFLRVVAPAPNAQVQAPNATNAVSNRELSSCAAQEGWQGSTGLKQFANEAR